MICTFPFTHLQRASVRFSIPTHTCTRGYSNFGAAATSPPAIILCDTACSDTWWTGTLLGEAFENTTTLFTNGTEVYCTTEQEDSATLNALMWGAMAKLVDFLRIIVMRSASDFDRPSPGETAAANLLEATPGVQPSILNLKIAGVQVVQAIRSEWASSDGWRTKVLETA
ncbi:purine nucleoside permease-domain-containing protein [Mycena epipterygia]|nr:purine nucleoside permease-domain-containing protein [Mycena epipterygia]